MTALSSVVEQVCEKARQNKKISTKPLFAEECELFHGKQRLDLSLTYRFSNLPFGVKLELRPKEGVTGTSASRTVPAVATPASTSSQVNAAMPTNTPAQSSVQPEVEAMLESSPTPPPEPAKSSSPRTAASFPARDSQPPANASEAGKLDGVNLPAGPILVWPTTQAANEPPCSSAPSEDLCMGEQLATLRPELEEAPLSPLEIELGHRIKISLNEERQGSLSASDTSGLSEEFFECVRL
ncbi:hypothetical protein CYMTET_21214 [Cymbomonas tetramitiformis]|uniref:TUG ubiquitin-like domain-containing protein n=1 Tax=Cymbomonas tetramitiformis TaxID=36881 RepID=A0AAE0G2U2_9CHLO|nr:hypothetical protein CYMTET_21214 [Cymbomonas tetramitiformis]